jgi:predicted nucleic acid-binding protein
MIYFVDTNIIIDLLVDREPFSENAIRIFESVHNRGWTLYTSDNAITTSYYYLRREIGKERSKATIASFLVDIEIVSVSKQMLATAAVSKFNDYEDAVQFHCAISISGIDGIITRNKNFFKHSTIPVFAPEEVLF